MSRFFRWQLVVPRLLLVIVALLAAQYALGLAVRTLAVRSGEAVLGARVEIAHARVSLLDRQVVLGDLRVANPLRPEENLLQADHGEFDFAFRPLLRKQTIIERGRLTGLRFNTQREDLNAATPEPPPANKSLSGKRLREGDSPHFAPARRLIDTSTSKMGTVPDAFRTDSNWFTDAADEAARDWLARLNARFDRDVAEQFDSVARCEALYARLPAQSAAVDQRASELQQRAAELQQATEIAQANRLRNAPFFDGLPDEIAALRQEFAALIAEVEQLPQSLEAERRTIAAALRHDEATLREQLQLDPVDAAALTAYLLRQQAVAPLDELIGWLRWTRQAVPVESTQPTPNFLIRALQLQGESHIAGQPVEFRALLTGVTATPSLHGEPMRLRLVSTDSLPLELHATIDRTGAVARDELLLDYRGIRLPELNLGRPDQFQVVLGPSVGSLSVSIRVEGEKLSGDIQLVQNEVRIKPTIHGELSELPLAAPLQATLGAASSIATRLALHGTIDEPTCSLWSNLGPAAAEAMERSLRHAGETYARAVVAETQRRIDERLADLQRLLTEQQIHLASQMTAVTSHLETIAAQQAPHQRISAERLGRRLPEHSLFR